MVRIKAVTVLHSSGKFHNSNNIGLSHPQDYWLVTFFLKTVTGCVRERMQVQDASSQRVIKELTL